MLAVSRFVATDFSIWRTLCWMIDFVQVKSTVVPWSIAVNVANGSAGFTKYLCDSDTGLQLLRLHEMRHKLVSFETTLFRNLVVHGGESECNN